VKRAPNPKDWTARYEEALSPKVIKERATVRAVALPSLDALNVEEACRLLELQLKAVFVVTARCLDIIQLLVGRALAHARLVYADPRSALRAMYDGVSLSEEPYIPVLITGPAGVGKSKLREAVARVLPGRREVYVDESHPNVPLNDYELLVVAGRKSQLELLRPLASPEVAVGRAKIRQDKIALEAARWQRFCGCCLLGADELQFLSQSASASTLLTSTMLCLADVRIPWFAMLNYSACWKLLARPAEAGQRLLKMPVVMHPDAPDSDDWRALMCEYDVVCKKVCAFKLVDKRSELWRLSAGLKREVVALLAHAYRLCRMRGAKRFTWTDILKAYASVEFYASRTDVELLIAHAAQGGVLSHSLACPFQGKSIEIPEQAYRANLLKAREVKLNRSVLEAALNKKEIEAIEGISAASNPVPSPKRPPKKKHKRPTLEALLAAGRRRRQNLGLAPQ